MILKSGFARIGSFPVNLLYGDFGIIHLSPKIAVSLLKYFLPLSGLVQLEDGPPPPDPRSEVAETKFKQHPLALAKRTSWRSMSSKVLEKELENELTSLVFCSEDSLVSLQLCCASLQDDTPGVNRRQKTGSHS